MVPTGNMPLISLRKLLLVKLMDSGVSPISLVFMVLTFRWGFVLAYIYSLARGVGLCQLGVWCCRMPHPGQYLLNAGGGVACDEEDNLVSAALDDGSVHGLEVVLARLAGRDSVPVLAGILCGAQDIVGDFGSVVVAQNVLVELVCLGGDLYVGNVGLGGVDAVHGVAFRCCSFLLPITIHSMACECTSFPLLFITTLPGSANRSGGGGNNRHCRYLCRKRGVIKSATLDKPPQHM